jgi:hypothetical protein
MTSGRRVRGLIAAGLLAALAGASSTPARAAASCAVRGDAMVGVAHSHVVAMSASIVVYRSRGAMFANYWACRRGTARRVFIGRSDAFDPVNYEYGRQSALRHVLIAGDWVTVIHETGFDIYNACTKYNSFPCPGPIDNLVAVDVSSGQRGRLASFDTDHSAASGAQTIIRWRGIVLSSVGAVAWLTSTVELAYVAGAAPTPEVFALYGCSAMASRHGAVRCAPHLIATGGAIDANSLRLRGTALTWTVGGQPESASLRFR